MRRSMKNWRKKVAQSQKRVGEVSKSEGANMKEYTKIKTTCRFLMLHRRVRIEEKRSGGHREDYRREILRTSRTLMNPW